MQMLEVYASQFDLFTLKDQILHLLTMKLKFGQAFAARQ